METKGVLIFNENAEERRRLADLLQAEDFSVFETPRVLEAVHILKTHDIGLVLASQSLDGIEGPEFKDLVEGIKPGTNVMFVGPVLSGGKGLSLSLEEFRQTIQGFVRVNADLSRKVRDFKEFFFSFADRLIQIFEVNDRYFFNNDHMVSQLSKKIALKMGLPPDMADAIQMAALLKDIGKVGIHHQLLEEKKRLSSKELVPIKNHPLNTVEILKQIKFPWNVDAVISQHHEHYDGGGYPLGIKGRQISIGARIISIADSFVAMIMDRPYRKAIPKGEAMQEMLKKAGSQFDPEVLEAFLSVIKEDPFVLEPRWSVLILERQPTVSALIRLSINAGETEIVHAANSFDALRHIRHKAPDLIVADVEMLDRSSFLQFYNVMQEIPAVADKPFIFIVPDADYPRHFKGRRQEYVIKPLNAGELSSKVKVLLGEEAAPQAQAEAVRGLSGTLDDFSLTDIVQILNLGLKTARVEVISGTLKGVLYIRQGKVVYAATGTQTGSSAFFEMLTWKSGTFQILHGQAAPGENITMDTLHLLLEATRVLDETGKS